MPTLEQLESDVWPPTDVHTNLIDTCHRLRKKPVEELSAGELRIMIGQKLGLRYLVPLALDLLENDPLMDATFYPGDLLEAVVSADEDLFKGKPKISGRLRALATRVGAMPEFHSGDFRVTDRLARFVEENAT